MFGIPTALFVLVPLVILAITLILVFARMFQKTQAGTALVRTGFGGQKVIIDGGCIFIGLLHNLVKVNLQTVVLAVAKRGQDALITKDRMRVDLIAEFYLRVASSNESVAAAAQTLQEKTFDPNALKDMIEGKLVDALRSVAASMTMDELHESRAEFIRGVKEAVADDLRENGLTLESASLTGFDQTPFSALDENNLFNAQGMKEIAKRIADSKRERAAIEATTMVEVKTKELAAQQQVIALDRQEKEFRIQAERELAEKRAEAERASQEADIAKTQAIQQAGLVKERTVESERIATEQTIATANIAMGKALELAEQDRKIAIAAKSEEESRARASADAARAEAIKAQESVVTAQQVAEAERRRQIEIIGAQQAAEREATQLRIRSEAEKDAAQNRADARMTEAKAEADAMILRAEAGKAQALAEAEGIAAKVKAENELSAELIDLRKAEMRIRALPEVLAALVKPLESIDGVRVNFVQGLGELTNGTAAVDGGGAVSPVNEVFSGIMKLAVAAPTLRAVGEQLGLDATTSFDKLQSAVVNEVIAPKPAADGNNGGRG